MDVRSKQQSNLKMELCLIAPKLMNNRLANTSSKHSVYWIVWSTCIFTVGMSAVDSCRLMGKQSDLKMELCLIARKPMNNRLANTSSKHSVYWTVWSTCIFTVGMSAVDSCRLMGKQSNLKMELCLIARKPMNNRLANTSSKHSVYWTVWSTCIFTVGMSRSGWLQADEQAEQPQDGAVPDSPKANEQQVGKHFFKAFSLLNSVKHMYIYSGREPQWMVVGWWASRATSRWSCAW